MRTPATGRPSSPRLEGVGIKPEREVSLSHPHCASQSSPFLARTVCLIPAHNEAECVGETVRRWLEFGIGMVRVVDNASTDTTAEHARAAGANVVQEAQKGYGAAAWRGLQDWPEGMEWVLFSAADGSDRLSMEELGQWTQAVDNGADLLIGDRTHHLESRRCLTPAQRLGNELSCVAFRLRFGRRFRDMGSLRLVRHSALLSLGLRDRGFGWNVEMQMRALERHWKVVELPVRYFPRAAGESKISGNPLGTLRAAVGILSMLWRLGIFGNRRRPASLADKRVVLWKTKQCSQKAPPASAFLGPCAPAWALADRAASPMSGPVMPDVSRFQFTDAGGADSRRK